MFPHPLSAVKSFFVYYTVALYWFYGCNVNVLCLEIDLAVVKIKLTSFSCHADMQVIRHVNGGDYIMNDYVEGSNY